MLPKCYFCGHIKEGEVTYEHIGGMGDVPICYDRTACLTRRVETNTCKKCGGNIIPDPEGAKCLQCGMPQCQPRAIIQTDSTGKLIPGGR